MDGNAARLAVITGASRGIGEAFAHLLASEDARSLLVVPVVVEGQVIGALGVVSDSQDDFSDDQVRPSQKVGILFDNTGPHHMFAIVAPNTFGRGILTPILHTD